MTQAFVQKTIKFQALDVTSITSASITPSAGNQLVATVSAWAASNGGLPTTPWSLAAADGTNTWTTSLARGASNEYARGLIATALNVAGSAVAVTITPTVGGSGTFYCNGNIIEFSGTLAAAALDSVSATGQFAATATSVTASTSGATAQADELVVALLVLSSTDPTSNISTPATSGYTSIGTESNPYDSIGYEASYKIVSATGTQTADWTFDATDDASVWLIAAYKAAAGGGGGGSSIAAARYYAQLSRSR